MRSVFGNADEHGVSLVRKQHSATPQELLSASFISFFMCRTLVSSLFHEQVDVLTLLKDLPISITYDGKQSYHGVWFHVCERPYGQVGWGLI